MSRKEKAYLKLLAKAAKDRLTRNTVPHPTR